MLDLESNIKLDLDSIQSPNLVGRLSEGSLNQIGEWAWSGYDADIESRMNWYRRNEAGMDLAMQLVQEKSFPWPGCANVAFPLVTIATLQFHSRAYPELVPGKELVTYEVWGDDAAGKEAKRAERISLHMSHQCLKEDEAWEENHDKLMINYSVVGSAFIKTRRATAENKNKTEFVPSRYLVMDYWAKSVEACGRKTHLFPLYRNEVVERVRKGLWRDVEKEAWFKEGGQVDPHREQRESKSDTRAGLQVPMPDDLAPYWFGEQHTYLDLDGDGYAEPVIVTFETVSKCVVRIIYRFEREEDIERNDEQKIIRITPTESFTQYTFVPSPDGGVYGLGWGILLGPLAESVSSIVNQLLDAGTLSNTAGGFLSRSAKLKGGNYVFGPFTWQTVDVTGAALKDSMFPLPVREPSDTLFKLMVLLIDYANRISASTEMLSGENPGQNTPAQTSAAMVEQGMKIFASIFKRAWRSMKQEFEKLYVLNAIYAPIRNGIPGFASREDYMGDPARVMPSADPTVLSEGQRVAKAVALKQAAYTTPGYDLEAVEPFYLRSLRMPNWQTFYKGAKNVPPLPNFKLQTEQLKLQGKQLEIKQKHMSFVLGLLEQKRLNDAKILQLEAQAAKLVAEAGGVESGQKLEALKAGLEVHKSGADTLMKMIDLAMKVAEATNPEKPDDEGGAGGVPKLANGSRNGAVQGSPEGATGGIEGALGAGGIH